MIKYCPKCHREAYKLIEDGENVKVMQGKGTLLNINRSSSVSMDINCPNNHRVKLKIKPKEKDDGS